MESSKEIVLPRYMQEVADKDPDAWKTMEALADKFLKGDYTSFCYPDGRWVGLNYLRSKHVLYDEIIKTSSALHEIQKALEICERVYKPGRLATEGYPEVGEWVLYGIPPGSMDLTAYNLSCRNPFDELKINFPYQGRLVEKLFNLGNRINRKMTGMNTAISKFFIPSENPPTEPVGHDASNAVTKTLTNTKPLLAEYDKAFEELKDQNRNLSYMMYALCIKASDLGLFPQVTEENWKLPPVLKT